MQNFDFTRNGGTEVKDNNYTQEMFADYPDVARQYLDYDQCQEILADKQHTNQYEKVL